MHFNKKDFNGLLRKSSTNPSATHTLSNKGLWCKTADCVEFHTDNRGMLLELISDLLLRGMTSARRNPIAKHVSLLGRTSLRVVLTPLKFSFGLS